MLVGSWKLTLQNMATTKLHSIDIRSITRGDKWAFKNSQSCKDFVEFHGSHSLGLFSGYVHLAVSIFCQRCLWIFSFSLCDFLSLAKVKTSGHVYKETGLP